MNKWRVFLIAVTFAASSPCQAQIASMPGDTVRWNATGFLDVISNVTADAPCQFVTYGANRVDWIQAGGNFVTSFIATNISGSWPDLSGNGSVTYTVAVATLTGQIVFSRTDQGMKVQLTITGGSADINNSYTISSFDKL